MPFSTSLGKYRLIRACVISLFAVALLASPFLFWERGAHVSKRARAVSRRETLSREAEGRSAAASSDALAQVDAATRARLTEVYGQLPMRFEANRGQTDAAVKFVARGQGYALFLTPTEAVLSLRQAGGGEVSAADALAPEGAPRAGAAEESSPSSSSPPGSSGAVLRVGLVDANPAPVLEGVEELSGRSNYFVGADERGWVTDVAGFGAVKYESVYPGVDLVYYGKQRQLEYDFRLDAGADPARIALRFEGTQTVALGAGGDLVLGTEVGEVRQRRPFIYQEIDGARREVAGGYKLLGENRVAFEVGKYDHSRPLVIDPVLVYSTYLGGNDSDAGFGVAVDASGNAYIAGDTFSTDFPGPSPIQAAKGFTFDAFVLKLNPAGSGLIYATYLGGNGDDFGNAVAVDPAGNAYVAGFTNSDIFPLTAGALQPSRFGVIDGFVAKLNPSGTALVYSTLLGGNNNEEVLGVAADAAGNAYVAGYTDSSEIISAGVFDMRAGSPVYRSADGGGSWAEADNAFTASRVNFFAAHPTDAATIYAGASSGVFKTTDGGNLWSLTGAAQSATMPRFTNGVAIHPTIPETIYAATLAGVYKSANGGQTYEEKNTGLFDRNLHTIVIDPATPATLYAGSIFGAHKSTNGGDNWARINNGLRGPSSNFEPQVFDLVIDPTTPSVIYAGTSQGVFKTINGGVNWAIINTGLGDAFNAPSVTALLMDSQNPSTLYAAITLFGGNRLAKTTNGGGQWNIVGAGLSITNGATTFTPRIDALAIDPANPSVLYAGTLGAGVFKSTDGGANWARASAGLNNNSVGAIIVDRAVASHVFAGTNIGSDAFAGKINPEGTAVVHFRFLGGNENDMATGIAADAAGNAYITGHTASNNFPVVAGALQPASGGGIDAFLTKLNPSGAGLVYSTYLGGSSTDEARAVALGPAGSAYLTGRTLSTNFPLASPLKHSPSSFINDAFVSKVSADGTTLQYSTYLGGDSGTEQGFGIAVDAAGNAHVTGLTSSNDFPLAGEVQTTRGGGNDAFISKLNPSGSALVYSAYLGGFAPDQGNAVAVDAAGNTYVVGTTNSSNFPLASPLQNAYRGSGDAFIVKIGDTADLSITKTDSRDPVMVNNSLTYTLRVFNAGPSTATEVTVTDTLPASVAFVSATPSRGTCAQAAGVVTCALGLLAPQAEATVAIVVTPTSVGALSNTATVSSDVSDSNPSNNTATQTTTVSAMPSIAGRVTSPTGTPLAGITINLSGAQSASTQTGADGFYQFAGLTAGGSYTVAPSAASLSFNPQSRSFENLVADQTADFIATPCTYTVTPASQSFGAAGGAATATVTTLQGCPWNAASGSNWITVTAGASGVGSGVVNFTVAATSAPRAGRLTVAGKNIAVYQEFDSCAAPGFTASGYNIGSSPTLVQPADLNGDGHLDLVVATNALTGADIRATIMLNDGAGHFTAREFASGLGGVEGFALGDFNGDGRPDIAMTTYNSAFVKIHFNNGSGGFGQSSATINFSTQNQSPLTRRIHSGDINKDGKPDLLVSTPGTEGLQILLANGDGSFTQANPVGLGPAPAHFLSEVADVNGDSNLDLLLVGGGGSSRQLAVVLGDGAGNFGAKIVSPGSGSVFAASTRDFDGDGKSDIAAATTLCDPFGSNCSNAILILKGDGAGNFTVRTTFNAPSVAGFTVADFNNDAKPDVAYTTGNQAVLLPGDGDGGLGPPQMIAPQTQFSGGGIAAADLNGDARPDLAVTDYNRGAWVLTNNCAGGPTISGRVTHVFSTRGLGGVMVTLGGAQAATTQTDEGGNYTFRGLMPGAAYTVTPSKENYRFAPPSASVGNLAGDFRADFVATPITVRFAANHYVVDEFGGSLTVSVTRAGDTSGAASVNYATADGSANERQDYTPAIGTLHFAPGETTRSFKVILTNDARVEGWELFNLTLSSPSGAILEFPHTVMVEIRDDDSNPNASNPIDDPPFFVRQHYADFLNREPDTPGITFWSNQITECGLNTACVEVRRINVSAAFFLSGEFQQTGYLVYRTYGAAFGTTRVGSTVPLTLREFLPDTQRISRGVIVNSPGWEETLEQNKVAYFDEFVLHSQFLAQYPQAMAAAEFVDALNAKTSGSLSPAERDALVAGLAGGTKTRAQVLRAVAEDSDFDARERNRAFVLMQYFGYLRRNPNDAPELGLNFNGYSFWLQKLNNHGGNFVSAEMVKAFITSGEYRERFR